jgi:hypothetical protein
MTYKGYAVPDDHQQTKSLQIKPAHADKGTSPNIPKKITEGSQVLDMGKLVDHDTLDSAMGLQGPGISAEQNGNTDWRKGKYTVNIPFHFIYDPWCIKYAAYPFSFISLSPRYCRIDTRPTAR